jgi:hypothetical protein
MLNAIIIAIAVALTGYLALSKRLAGSSSWKATVTPLASIMGIGFLPSDSADQFYFRVQFQFGF